MAGIRRRFKIGKNRFFLLENIQREKKF